MVRARYVGSLPLLWRHSQNFSIDLAVSGVDLNNYRVEFVVHGPSNRDFKATSDDLITVDASAGTVKAELNADSKPPSSAISFKELLPNTYKYKFDFLKADGENYYSDFSLQGDLTSVPEAGSVRQASPAPVGTTINLNSSGGLNVIVTVHGWDEARISGIETQTDGNTERVAALELDQLRQDSEISANTSKNAQQDSRLDALENTATPDYVLDTDQTSAQVRVQGAWQPGYNKTDIDASQAVQDASIASNQSDIATNKADITTLEEQINSGVSLVGTWDADTNTPDLSALTLSNGQYYLVDVAGTTDLNGLTDWQIGDWAIWFDDTPGNWEHYRPPNSAQNDIDDHKADKANPHGVTAEQAGADPEGSAQAVATALMVHTGNESNPHSVTHEQVGADPAGSAAQVAQDLNTHANESTVHWQESRIATLESEVSTLKTDLAALTTRVTSIETDHIANALIHFGDAAAGDNADYVRFNRTWASRVSRMHTVSTSSNTPIVVPDGTFVQIAQVTIDRLSYGGVFGFDGLFIPDGNQSRVLEVDIRIDGTSTGNIDSLIIAGTGVHYTIAGGFDNTLPVDAVVSVWAQFLAAAGTCESHNMNVSTTYLDSP